MYSDSGKKLDWCRTSRARSERCSEFYDFNEDDCIAQARNSSSRSRCSHGISEIQGGIQVKLPNFYTLVNSIADRSFENRRRTQEEISILYKFCWNTNSFPPSYPWSLGRESCGSVFIGQRVDPDNLFEFIYHVGSCFKLHSIIASGLIAGGKTCGRARQTVFFAAVDPTDQSWVEQEKYDLTQPSYAAHKQNWKFIQDAVYSDKICRAQNMELQFFQTRSNAIILHNALPATCIERVSRTTKERLYTRTKSPRLAPTIMLKSNWRNDLVQSAPEGTVWPVLPQPFDSSNEQPSQPSRLESTERPVTLKSRAELDQ